MDGPDVCAALFAFIGCGLALLVGIFSGSSQVAASLRELDRARAEMMAAREELRRIAGLDGPQPPKEPFTKDMIFQGVGEIKPATFDSEGKFRA